MAGKSSKHKSFEQLGREIGKLTDIKNVAYGNSSSACGDFLKILYPNGVQPRQYVDMLLLVRIFDKQMRIATNENALGEDPYRDVTGYGLCGVKKNTKKK